MKIKHYLKLVAAGAVIAIATGCTVNPVTGRTELGLVTESQEIALGNENYPYMQQAGGGQYDIDPELTTYVQGIGNRLAAVSDRQLPYEFVVLNSSVPNAWALPGGKIAINRGLLTEMSSEAELAAVIGHEIVHAAARHSARQMQRGMLLQAAILGTAIMSRNSDYSNLAVGGANVGAQLINQTYGRDAELESDFYGMQYMSRAGYDPQGAVELQRTFVRLSEGRRTDWLSGLFASHPPSQERVDANIQTATSLPAGGETGEARFRAALERTLDTKPAYDLYDEGREALAEENHRLALRKANEAIDRFPDEAHFYGLRGDARYVADQFGRAINNYDIAIRRRPDFFQYHLQRGLANQELGNHTAARSDLERSNQLFPTAAAHNSLGDLAARAGDRTQAIQHYQVVAGVSGPMGEQATAKLIRLDLADNPDKYLRVGCFADSDGNLAVAIRNATPVAVRNIRLAIEYRDSTGALQTREESIRGPVAPGQRADRGTGIGPWSETAGCPVRIIAARVAE